MHCATADHRLGRCLVVFVAVLVVAQTPPALHAAGAAPPIDFNRQIQPILAEHCFACHGPDAKQRKAKLRLDVKDGAVEKRKDGSAAIVPGKSAASELMRRITAAEIEERMPPAKTGKKLSTAQIELLRQWIDQGAPWSTHWAFEPPRRQALPAVKRKDWVRNPIDYFILSRLEREGLQPSAEAPRETLVRRLALDLTGLPPKPALIDAFLKDTGAQAYDNLVERLLASPHYGERMALDWLDAARFADTHGYHLDSGRDMTRWRQWVIEAYNRNVPFDQFTIEQLAGDLLPNATVEQRIASGFNRNHMINFEGGAIPEEYHAAYIVDRVNTTGTVWLGLSVACAQCHDHKFDPMSQKEYYELFAYFNNVPENGLDGMKGNATPVLAMPSPQQQKEQSRLAAAIKEMDNRLAGPLPEVDAAQEEWEEVQSAAAGDDAKKSNLPARIRTILAVDAEERSAAQQKELRDYFRKNVSAEGKKLYEKLAELRKARDDLDSNIPTAMVMQEMAKPRDTFMLVRGQYDKKGDKVRAAVPAFLPSPSPQAPNNRLGLAQWLMSPEHPLTARVIVNRYWQIYFGTGLVKTAEDFGTQGERPSHPELLDWLATEFIVSGWDVKHMQRLIVTSATYRQSSAVIPALAARDPENRLLARGPRMRLQAEFIRDQALAVSGLLNDEIAGKSVSPYQPAGLWTELSLRQDSKKWSGQFFVQSHGKDLYRRSMYTFWKRTSPPPQMITFDAPDRETCTVRRARTNTPLQALVLMNDPTYLEASRKLAERMMLEGGKSAEERIAFAFRLATARRPSAAEVQVLRRVFEQQLATYRDNPKAALKVLQIGEAPRREQLDAAELAAWALVASTILNLDEVLTKG